MAKGVFQTDREIFENPIWQNVIQFRIFFYIYGNAVFADEGVTVAGIHLKRGQFLRSYRNLRDDLAYRENRTIKKYPLTTLTRAINQLVEKNRIEIKGTDYGTLFTVVKYDEYQGFERFKKIQMERSWNRTGTETEQSRNNNKNVKNDKNKTLSSSTVPVTEIIEYLNQKTGKHFTTRSVATKKKINARWNEGHGLDEFKKVIDVKSAEWNGTDAAKWLRPETLFGTKFEAYLNEQPTGKPAVQQESKSERIERLQKFVTDQHVNGSTPDEIQIMVAELGANLSIEKINKIIEIGDE